MNAKFIKLIADASLEGAKIGVTVLAATGVFLVVGKSAEKITNYSTQAYHDVKNKLMKRSSNRPKPATKAKKATTVKAKTEKSDKV